jgi:hypothetical protein
MLTLGGDETLLWILLPIVVFLAGYTPGAVNYVVGQAAFTVFVVVLFNVLVPDGWRVGLVRVQDVAIGAGISVVAGALLWPRGARGVARRAFAELLGAGAARVEAAVEHVLRRTSADPAVASAAVADARARAVAALEDLALEHGGGHVERTEWSSLLVEALLLDLAADGISRSLPCGLPATVCPDARAALSSESNAVLRSVDAAAAQLVRSGVRSLADRQPLTFRAPDALARCLEAHVDHDLHDALALLWIHEWLLLAGEHELVGA